jgi:hypothetical protein
MACDKWEEIGLLYCSSELDQQDAKSFETHLYSCTECKTEFDEYQKERTTFFTSEILGETTSRKIDDEILRVCTAQKQFTSIGIFPSLVKKSILSVSFLIMGFVVAGYFVFNIENANRQKHGFAMDPTKHDSLAFVQKGNASTEASISSKDSSKDSAVYFSRTRGNLNTNGVFPVDLK